ncbi:UBX domain-containing protein 10 [Indicator indicator]|uniref:UBX domain-containing protein 10 n=1 Tax=Indicator indicator TaxID=1002788 RepID=UPI0023E00795|nr:UBX domain-containing protein 10 [Indicator indicator]
MATAALLNSAPARLSSPRGTAAPSSWANAGSMHVTRPKSAKGRRRPSFSCSQSLRACPCQVPPSSPAAARQGLANSRRVLATNPACRAGRLSPGEVPALLQQVPLRSCSSLNRYRVLPSIGWRGAVDLLAEQTDRLSVGEGQEGTPRTRAAAGEQGPAGALSERAGPDVQCPPEKPGRKTRQESPPRLTLGVEESPEEESELLLAVRSPSGQRFQHCFKPTDSLRTVLAVAEQKTSSRYKHCILETMEVPRRSFSDLTRSLQECGILHKSVLCIRLKGQRDPDL